MNDDQQTEISTTADSKPIRSAWSTAPSLKPGISVMDGCVAGNEEAIAIRDAWRLRESRATMVVVMTKEDWDKAVSRTPTFGG